MADTRGDIPFYGPNPLNYALTVGTSSVQVLTANPVRKGLFFHNPNATAKIAVCCATNNLNQAQPAVINGAGSMMLVPLAVWEIDEPWRPVSAWNAISDTPGAFLTIFEFL
jgi:hypothetical protein